MDWALYAWLKRGKRRKSILTELNKSREPLTANDLSKKLNIAISQTSFTLKELTEKELIKCLNPADKIGKLYLIRELDKELLEYVNNKN